nr:hypothetical protein BCU03_10555 [Vibrio breoganii]
MHDVCALRDKKKFLVGDDGLRFEKFNKRKTQSPIKLREKLRFTGTVKQMNISKRAGKYFSRSLLIPKTTTLKTATDKTVLAWTLVLKI